MFERVVARGRSLGVAALALFTAFIPFTGADRAVAQACPTPVSVNGTACTVASGTTINVLNAATPGLDARNPGGAITAQGVTINLGPGVAPRTFVGAQALSGAAVELGGSTIRTLTTAATGQRGAISDGTGSVISGDGTTISLGAGAATASDNLAVIASNGGTIDFRNAVVATLGGVNGIGNHAATATGSASRLLLQGATFSTVSRGSFGVQAVAGGQAKLTDVFVTTTGANTTTAPLTGSHALIADGGGSSIEGTRVTLSTSGLLANAARAQNGGLVTLSGSTITTTSTASSDADPSAALRATTGGRLIVDGTTITTTGARGVGMAVDDAGSLIQLRSSSIDFSGNRIAAAVVQNGGRAEISSSDILSRGSAGVFVLGTGSTLDLVGSTVRAQGNVGYGIRVTLGGAAAITDTTILTEGLNGAGLYASNGSIIGDNVTILTTGDENSMGVLADGNSDVVLNGGSVTTLGSPVRVSTYANGMAARNPDGRLTAIGTSVTTSGTLGFGVVADDGGAVILDGNAIRTAGDSASGLFSTVEQAGAQFRAGITGRGLVIDTTGALSHGALASQHFLVGPSVIDLTDTSLTTHGAASDGLRSIGSATVDAGASSVLTEGDGSMGLHARDNGSSVNIANTSVVTTGENAHGALANAGGLVTGVGSEISATGANSYALYVAGASGFVSRANFDDSRLGNVSGPALAVGGVGEVTLTNSVVGGSPQWLRVATIADFTPLAAPDSGPEGVQDPEGLEFPTPLPPPPGALPVVPGLADVTLDGSTVTGSAFTAVGSVSNLMMRNDSVWYMTGSSNVTSLLNDPSLIQFSAPTGDPTLLSSYMTLTVVDYVGEDGNIGLNTYLDTDGSPSDRLIIDGGSATGASGLIISNTTGGGALTTGNGILVVDAINGGVTDPGAFNLLAPVAAGPYDYLLFRSSVDGSGPQNWYLRSELAGPPDPTPIYRPEVSLYAAVPSMAAIYGRHIIDTLHERVGEEEQLKGRTDIGEDEKFNGVWLRGIGHWGHRDGDARGVYDGAPEFDYRFGAMQGGMDFYRDEEDGVTDHAGMYFAYGHGRMDVTQNLLTTTRDAGRNDFDAFSLGGYWTRFGENGWYLDGVLQGTWYDMTTHSNRATAIGFPDQSIDGFGFAASLEGGYPLDLGDGWQLEPQAQLIWQTIHMNGFNDGAADVRYDNLNSLAGRIGARIARTWEAEEATATEAARLATVWGRVNLWHEFTAKAQTDISSANGFVPFSADLNEIWIEIGVGATRQISEKTSLYGNLNFSTTFDGDNYAWNGKFGLRVNW